MIFKPSRPIVVAIWLLFLFLSACAQPPNYAPVKMVNQTFDPDNGYIANKPSIKPINKTHSRQSTKFQKKYQQDKRPIYAINSSFSPSFQNKPTQNSNQAIKNESAKATITSKTFIGDRNQGIQQAGPFQDKTELPLKDKPSVDNSPVTQAHKSSELKQASIEPSKNDLNVTDTHNNDSHKKQQDTEKTPENLHLTKKNITEKKSIISNDNKKMLKLNFQWPLQGKISRNFAQTENKGIEIRGKMDQPVRASEAGKAVYCGQGLAGLGNLVIIKHNETYLSAYANNSKLTIKEGQQVEKGQTIGQVGVAGLKKASLHFEIRKNGKPINPLTVLPIH